jgi:hypothetical protein
VVLSLGLLAFMAGCSSNQKPVYPTKGRVVWEDGSSVKELSGGMVIFQSDAEEISAKAGIDEEGRFVLGTYTLDDGAVAGQHKVAIVQPSADESGDYKPAHIIDPKYESMETTDLAATIEPKSNEIVLKVTPDPRMKRQRQ